MNRHGFTLIEVMVCVVIVSIIAAVAIPIFNDACENGRAVAYLKTNGISEENAIKIATFFAKSTHNIRDTLMHNHSLFTSYTAEESLPESDKTITLSSKEVKVLKSVLSLNSSELDQAVSQSKNLSREEKSTYFGSSDSTTLFFLKTKLTQ